MTMFFPDNSEPEYEDPRCGDYEKGHEITGLMDKCLGPNEFYIKRKLLNPDDQVAMDVALWAKSPTGSILHTARPYTMEIGQMKLVFLYKRHQLVRCKIRQIFAHNLDGQLSVKAELLLIDDGWIIPECKLSHLYDFPPIARYLTDIEPELTRCQLDIPDNLIRDPEVREVFMNAINRHPQTARHTVKLRAFRDDKYYVDLLNSKRQSMIAFLKTRLKDKFAIDEKSTSETGDASIVVEDPKPVVPFKSNQYMTKFRPYTKRYYGAVHYFKEKAKELDSAGANKFLLWRRFFEVKMTIWEHPNDVYLIPQDQDYVRSHDELIREMNSYARRYNLDKEDESQFETVFKKGEYVIFRNRHVENIGSWLRGVIIGVPGVSRCCFVTLNKDLVEDDFVINEPVRGNVKNFVYRVRSIDYGFENAIAAVNIRFVRDKTIFDRRGSYSLRCRLFGLSPLCYNINQAGKKEFSDTCKLMLDAWMREKIVQDDRPQHFHALFRDNIYQMPETYQPAHRAMPITLFHRFEPPKLLEDIYLPTRKKKLVVYDCLNTYLIDSGYVTDDIEGTNNRSKVDLDHFLVNMLARYESIGSA